MKPETRLAERISKAIRKAYPDAWLFNVHGNPYQMSGVPDLLVCVRGLLVAMEIKDQKPGESEQHARDRATVTQRAQIQRINRAGGMAGVVLSPAEALEMIERAFIKQEREHGHQGFQEGDQEGQGRVG